MLNEFQQQGCLVLKNFFTHDELNSFKMTILDHQDVFINTRPNPTSGHLVQFHKNQYFKDLYQKILNNKKLIKLLSSYFKDYSALELTDITINRSQPWHTDLLRGKYSPFIEHFDLSKQKPIFKVLIYLNDQSRLKCIKKFHLKNLPLNDNEILEIIIRYEDQIESLNTNYGDVVLMDLRLPHSGLSEEETFKIPITDPKILITLTFGDQSNDFVKQFLKGNHERTKDWMVKYNYLQYKNKIHP